MILKAITKNPLLSKFRAIEDIIAPNPNCKTPITPLATPAFFEKCSIAKDIQFPKMNRLVIDAGTCITYDFIDENDNYLGGGISPGFRLRYEALHQFTAKLPLLSLNEIDKNGAVDDAPKLIGNSTQQSIHSGVINGLVNEINGFIGQYESQYSKFIIILTGGDTEFLAMRLKNTIFANRNFLLESLNQTYQYNIKND